MREFCHPNRTSCGNQPTNDIPTVVLSDNECGEVAIPSAKEVMHKAVFGYALKDSDMDVPSGTWLGCDTITAFQLLLQNHHPYIDGLQDVLLKGHCNGF